MMHPQTVAFVAVFLGMFLLTWIVMRRRPEWRDSLFQGSMIVMIFFCVIMIHIKGPSLHLGLLFVFIALLFQHRSRMRKDRKIESNSNEHTT